LHGRERVGQWKKLAAQSRWNAMVQRLLVEHYDPAYLRSIGRNFAQVGQARRVTAERADESEYARLAQELAAAPG
jgi:tRNA 2-selenouridine synthase